MKKTTILFVLILFLSSLGQVAADLYLPSLPAISHDLGVQVSWVQLSVSLYMFGYAFSQLLFGPISDGVGRKKPMMVGIAIVLMGSLICLFAHSVLWLIIGRFIQGVGAGGSVLLSRVVLRDIYSGSNLAKFGSYLAMGGIIIMSSAPLLGGYIQAMVNWRGNFAAILLYALVCFVVVCFKLPETNQYYSRHHLHPRQWFRNVMILFKNKVFVGMSVIIFITYAGILSWLTAGPILLQVQAGLTPTEFGWVALIVGLSYGVGAFVNGQLVDRLGINVMLLIGLGLMLFSSLVMLVLGVITIQVTALMFVGPIAMFIAATGFVFANAYACALTPFSEIAGIAGSIFGFMQVLGGAVFSMLLAYLHEETQIPLALCLIGLSIVGLLAFFRCKK